jgi:hypothetical protein
MKFRYSTTEQMTTIGKGFAAAKYEVKHPVVILPGFASSGLECEAGFGPWVNNRVWLSLAKLGFAMTQKISSKNTYYYADHLNKQV